MTKRKNLRYSLTALSAIVALTLTGCVATGGTQTAPTNSKDAPGPLIVQSRLTAGEGEALKAVVDEFNKKGEGKVEINSVTDNSYPDQLPTYLTSKNPPDIYTYLSGEASRVFADEGLVLDISDIWKKFTFNDGLKALSTDSSGKQFFVPTSNYWLGIYYDKTLFQRLGIQPPKTWDEFKKVAQTLKDNGVTPIGMGLSDFTNLSSTWFDYLDLRVNGPKFHLDLLAGKKSFDSPQVKAVFEKWNEIKPYFDPNSLGLSFQQSTTDFVQNKTGLYLAGAWLQFNFPQDQLDKYDFFKFPVIDSKVPDGEEAPTDGFFASSRTDKPNLAKRFLSYLASAEAQELMYKATGSGTLLPTNPDAKVDLTSFAKKGKEIIDSAKGLSQWFNRDAGDDVQLTANQAINKYLGGDTDVAALLKQWQKDATTARDARSSK